MTEDAKGCGCALEDQEEGQAAEAAACPCRGVEDRLLLPFVLVHLARKPSCGYELISSLDAYGRFGDASTVYKNLRRMEKEGLIRSEWETSESGPAKRVYHLTDDGRELLVAWRATIERNRALMGRFLEECQDFEA